MTVLDLDFLKDACSMPWRAIDLGGIENGYENNEGCRVNHVYVDCPTPFLIAATSLELSTGEEVFGVTVIREPVSIDSFLQGPHYPHNKPKTLPLSQVIGRDVDEFLESAKEVSWSRKTLKDFSDGIALVTVEQGLTVASHLAELRVYADDAVPMSLRVSWTEPYRKPA